MRSPQQRPISISIAPRSIILAFFLTLLCLLVLRLTDIVVLIVVSVLFAAALNPSVRWFREKLNLPKWLAITLIYFIVVAITILIVVALVPAVTSQLQSLSENWPAYQTSILHTFNDTPALQKLLDTIFAQLGNNSAVIVTRLASATLGVLVSLFGFITIMVLSGYFLAGGRPMAKRLLSYLPEKRWSNRGMDVVGRISNKLGYWLRGQFVLSVISFVMIYVGLRILKVDYALTLALIAGLLESIPTFGAIISGTLGTLVALAVSPGLAIAVAIYYIVVQQIQGNIITPQVMKRALGIPAVMIILSLLIFGKLFGLIGVLFAAPMAAIIAILAQEFGPDLRRMWDNSRIKSNKEVS